jgi:hypothetical protein
MLTILAMLAGPMVVATIVMIVVFEIQGRLGQKPSQVKATLLAAILPLPRHLLHRSG